MYHVKLFSVVTSHYCIFIVTIDLNCMLQPTNRGNMSWTYLLDLIIVIIIIIQINGSTWKLTNKPSASIFANSWSAWNTIYRIGGIYYVLNNATRIRFKMKKMLTIIFENSFLGHSGRHLI